MSDSLTTLIGKVQTLLLDDGTRFTTATVTAAVRQALKEFNLRAPAHAGTLEAVVADQKEYVLSGTDYNDLIEILDVLLWDDDGDDYEPLSYDDYFEDVVPVIRLRSARTDPSEFLVVRYSLPYTVNGLDSATESTLPAFFDPILLDGACYWSLQIRAVGRVETINLNQDVSDNLDQLKDTFKAAFEAGLERAARRKPAVGEPDTRAWNDVWHDAWGQ